MCSLSDPSFPYCSIILCFLFSPVFSIIRKVFAMYAVTISQCPLYIDASSVVLSPQTHPSAFYIHSHQWVYGSCNSDGKKCKPKKKDITKNEDEVNK